MATTTGTSDTFPLNERKSFPTALDDYFEYPLTTLREFAMLRIMDSITDKPNWESKVFNGEIAAKWKAEAVASDSEPSVTQSMMDWVIEELRFKAQIFKETGAISAYDGDVVKSDSAIPESLRQSLKATAAVLEDVPEQEKDYHPGSDGQVLDLVHPSLFPLVNNRSRIIKEGGLTIDDGIRKSGQGVVLKDLDTPASNNSNRFISNRYSHRFQWLPCEVSFKSAISEDPGSADSNQPEFRCEISSYINNLHPGPHGELYRVLEQILHRTVPLWDMTLTGQTDDLVRTRIWYDRVTYDPDPEEMPEDEIPQQGDDENDDDHYERLMQWEDEVRQIVQPEPEAFIPPSVPKYKFLDEHKDQANILEPKNTVNLFRDYKDTGLQVIVKLANIHLTPEKPEYPGGSWHVEGQLNERICATALYYYDSENITESRLAFRAKVDGEIDIQYQQHHDKWLAEVFGCENGNPKIQNIGSIGCKEGRLLTFPNVFQHQVQPFQLEDPTKPGHRKILAFFLVDPNRRILSTAHVPSQRRDWWEAKAPLNQALTGLPQELKDEVIKETLDFPITMEDAKEIRLELMEERKQFIGIQTDLFTRETFALCEH